MLHLPPATVAPFRLLATGADLIAGNDTLNGGEGNDVMVGDADGAAGSGATASITLAGTDLSSLGASDAEIIDTMLAQENLDAV